MFLISMSLIVIIVLVLITVLIVVLVSKKSKTNNPNVYTSIYELNQKLDKVIALLEGNEKK